MAKIVMEQTWNKTNSLTQILTLRRLSGGLADVTITLLDVSQNGPDRPDWNRSDHFADLSFYFRQNGLQVGVWADRLTDLLRQFARLVVLPNPLGGESEIDVNVDR